MFNNLFPEDRAVYEIMSKNMVKPYRPGVTIEYRACALHPGELKQLCKQLLLFHGNNCSVNAP
jgi:hypothetical protein